MGGMTRVEGEQRRPGRPCKVEPAPTATPEHDALAVIVHRFKEQFPSDWEALRLCPLQHGLETMIEMLK